MKIYARAKVNLALDVLGQDSSGYHQLDMIMAPISLYNEVTIEKADQMEVVCTNGQIPSDSTAARMLRLLHEKEPTMANYKVSIQEHIPMQAGLAGASANAAAVLYGVDQMESWRLAMDEKIALAKQIGADVPFCLYNVYARVQGIGEKIYPIPCDWTFSILLVKPAVGVSTPEAFAYWHQHPALHPDMRRIQQTIVEKDLPSYCQVMANALEPAAFSLVPELNVLKNRMEALGLSVLMTGSGSTLMGFGSDEQLQKAKIALDIDYPFVEIVTVG